MTELRLYQTVHVAGGHPRLVGAHAALLAEAARTLFGYDYAPDTRQLESRIAAVARAERYPQTVSGFVRIELTADGSERLLPAGLSFYNGYALRSLTPDARIVRCEIPFADLPTSAREALHGLADRQAQTDGGDIALLADHQGICRTADSAPLFAVRGNDVFTDPTLRSVERDAAAHAIRALGLTLHEEPIRCDELDRLDELFFVDHRGVTALAHCGDTAYMSLTAERTAERMEELFA